MKYEELVNEIGSFGVYQQRLVLLAFLANIPNAFATVMFVFTNFTPEFHCGRITMETQIMPSNGTGSLDSCLMLENYTDANVSLVGTTTCMDGWVFENNNTVIAEFSLVCDNAWKGAFIICAGMVGKLFAGLSGKISDRFGRRPVFLLFTLGQFVLMGVIPFARTYETYVTGILLLTYCVVINFVSSYVLVTEMVGKKKRKLLGTVSFLGFATGYMIIPALAYAFPYWRWYMRVNMLIGILFIPYYWIYPESLRWLLVSGRRNEAKKLAIAIAKMNKKIVDVDEMFGKIEGLTKDNDLVVNIQIEERHVKAESSLLDVMKNSTMRWRYLSLWFIWFTVNIVYYSITLYPTYLSGNRYINTFLAALVEIPGNLIAFLSWKLIGGTRSLFLFLLTAGISCVVSLFVVAVSPILTTVVVMLAKCAITGGFSTVYILTAEISPTLVRNTTMGVASAFSRIGGIVLPFIMFAGELDEDTRYIPYLVMGALTTFSSLLCIMVIPETRGIPMPDTVKDAISNKRVYKLHVCKKFSK